MACRNWRAVHCRGWRPEGKSRSHGRGTKTVKYFDIKSKNTLVIGATGFIGSHLASALAFHGSNVVCVSRNIGNRDFLTPKSMTWDECDASKRTDVERIINLYRPEIIYHLASDSKGG